MDNIEILGRIIRSTIGVIGRRTSESYATLIVRTLLKNLETKYSFLEHIDIKNEKFKETVDVVNIKIDINDADPKKMGQMINEFIRKITISMGKSAGYFFIKEIKEDLPPNYEYILREIDVDFDFLQMEYITERKSSFKFGIQNTDILKNVFKALYNIMDYEYGRRNSISKLREIIKQYSTEYNVLNHVRINDTSAIQGVDPVSVDVMVNETDEEEIGKAIQKIFQEINKMFGERGGIRFIEKIKNNLNFDYMFKLEEIGVNLNVLQLGYERVVKMVIKALIDVLSEASSQSYAILCVENVIEKTKENYPFLSNIKIDKIRYNESENAISITENIDNIRPTEMGRSIQSLIDKLIKSLGDAAGADFVNRFRERLGNAYLIRIEEMGVNLHMIELKQNLIF